MAPNERYPSLDRTLGTNKPVDPATRLSELLAQSLEELTRPFDPAHPAPPREAAAAETPGPEQTPEESRIDADKALAELEAELFAAAKQVNHDAPAPAAEVPAEHGEEPPIGGGPERTTEHGAAEAPSADQPEAILAAYSAKPSGTDAPNEA